jgi:PEP-CTERM motif
MTFVKSRGRYVQSDFLAKCASRFRWLAMTSFALLGCSIHSSAVAGIVTNGESNAAGLSVGISVTLPILGTGGITLSGQPTASGNAPAPYSTPNSEASINVNAGITGGATVSTGALNVLASSTVNGTAGSQTAFASSSVTGLAVSVGPSSALLSISSGNDVLTETSTASGTYGSLTTTGSLQVVGSSSVVISVLGITEATITAGEIIAPNFTIDIAGVGSLILNKQIADAVSNINTFAGTTSDFLALSIDPSVLGVASAGINIVVDQTHADLFASAVPEPSSLILASIGALTFLGTVSLRRRAN